MFSEFISNLESHIENTSAQIATVHGRYYAMDRDMRMDRIAKTWNILCKPRDEYQSDEYDSSVAGIESSYAKNIGDEFIVPFRVKGVDGEITLSPGQCEYQEEKS